MNQFLFNRYSGPLIALGVLVAAVCLAGFWYINRLQANLAKTVSEDAVAMAAALDLQVQLRHLRVHSLILVADHSPARRDVVQGDLARVDQALAAMQQTAKAPDDQALAERIVRDYARYKANLDLERLPSSTGPMANLAQWSDAHHMEELLGPCRQLADHQRQRMNDSLAKSETQTSWAGRTLFMLGLTGILAGLLSGYITARTITHRVARLSIQIRAVQAHLDHDVGAMTVTGPPHFGELDEQLDRVVDRVSAVCRRLQEQERELLRAEQLAAVGQLAAAVAHEVRNPLTGVKLLLQAAVRPSHPTPLSPDRLQLLLNEIARIERTMKGLMDFAHPSAPSRQPQDVRAAVAAAIEVAQSRADTKALVIRFDPGPIHLSASIDRDQFLSLLTNLLFNAIDASPGGGTIDVAIGPGVAGMMKVTVSDSGSGIDAAMADRLFTPFATSKPTGTGLGLTIARKIAREHGGELTVAPRPDGGTSCTIDLPLTEP